MKFVLFFLFVSVASAQTASEYFDQAMQAYEKKDYAANVKLLESTIQAGADHPTILYFLARGYALTGNIDAAILWLNKVADQGLSYKPEGDPNFAALHNSEKFQQVVQKFQSNLKRTENSKTAIIFQDKNFVPEGITYDSKGQTFYFGDAAGNRITRYKEKVFEEFSKPEDGLWNVLGMKIDQKRRILWATSAALAGNEKGSSGIFQYDLKNHKLLNKYVLPKGNHGLGDLEVDSAGNVYATDSNTPAVYRLKAGEQKLELFLGPEPFRSPQGLALSTNEKLLFVADYSRGIFAIDLATKKWWKLTHPEGATTVAGLDGLYLHDNSLIGIQNGFEPKRVLRIPVSKDGRAIERVDVLESNHPAFPEPTLGVVVGNKLYYIGNSLINAFLEDPKTELKPAVILELPL